MTVRRSLRRSSVVTAAVLLASAVAASCDDDGNRDDDGNGDGDGDVLVVREPGSDVAVAPGEEFAVELEANPTTGFSWEIAEPYDESVVTFLGERYLPDDSDQVGSPGSEQLRFVAAADGSTTITLEYVQPWDEEAAPAQEATFQVEVG